MNCTVHCQLTSPRGYTVLYRVYGENNALLASWSK